MLEHPAALSSAELEELQDLAARVIDHDAGRLKLEWATLHEGSRVIPLLERDASGRLNGFLGLYSFGGPPQVELVGMVDPSQRRRGIGTALLTEAIRICVEQGLTDRLLVVPRQSAAGHVLAAKLGATLDHSEHSLDLHEEPAAYAADERTAIRQSSEADVPELRRILTDAFGPPPDDMLERLNGDSFSTLIVEHDGATVGTIRLSLNDALGGVYGFAVDAEHRGRGIGRDVLVRICRRLREAGASTVHLEVETDNDRALTLYTSTGFVPTGTEDYYRL